MSNDFPPAHTGVYSLPQQPAAAGRKGKGGGRPPREKAPKASRRTLNAQRRIFLAFALIAAVLGVLLTTQTTPMTYVARFASDVPAMTEPSVAQIEAVAIDPNAVEPGAISGPDGNEVLDRALALVDGKRTTSPLFKGQQVREEYFRDGIALSAPLGADERLISISARAASAVAGTIRVGDRVDIYVAGNNGLTGLLRADVEVAGVTVQADQLDNVAANQLNNPDTQISELVPAEPIPGTYVLRVMSADVAPLIAADSAARIYLVLRGEGASITVATPTDVIATICGIDPLAVACTRAG